LIPFWVYCQGFFFLFGHSWKGVFLTHSPFSFPRYDPRAVPYAFPPCSLLFATPSFRMKTFSRLPDTPRVLSLSYPMILFLSHLLKTSVFLLLQDPPGGFHLFARPLTPPPVIFSSVGIKLPPLNRRCSQLLTYEKFAGIRNLIPFVLILMVMLLAFPHLSQTCSCTFPTPPPPPLSMVACALPLIVTSVFVEHVFW